MSVDIGGCYVVVLVVRKGAKIWQKREQTAKAIFANARTADGRDAIQQATIQLLAERAG